MNVCSAPGTMSSSKSLSAAMSRSASRSVVRVDLVVHLAVDEILAGETGDGDEPAPGGGLRVMR